MQDGEKINRKKDIQQFELRLNKIPTNILLFDMTDRQTDRQTMRELCRRTIRQMCRQPKEREIKMIGFI